MKEKNIHAVTGAFGYTGKYIARRLLQEGNEVITLTNSPKRENPFGRLVKTFPFDFDEPGRLRESLKGVKVLYNNYWVRFNHRLFKHENAVKNAIILFNAAKEAGVERIVHISITNPSRDSEFEYFSGKAVMEEALIDTGIPYAILRPTVIFGEEDILINNIAWALRNFPVFFTFGYGSCRLQPIFVDDLAKMAVEQGTKSGNVIINAVGPETFSYRELVENIGDIIGRTRLILPMTPALVYVVGYIISKIMRDVFVTREEIRGLMANLLYVDTPPTGETKLTLWAAEHAEILGRKYHNELVRRRDREKAY